MPQVGNIDVVRLDLEVYDATTEASLILTDPDGTVSAPIAGVKSAGGQTWKAPVTYTAPGIWYRKWVVTNTGQGEIERPVAVAPASGSDTRHTYATSRQLAESMQEAPPLDADKRLRDATADVDDLLLCAVYDVDDAGMPTDAGVKRALAEAVCALVEHRLETGDEAGTGAVQSASIAGVSLGWNRSSKGTSSVRFGPRVPGILAAAGLLGRGPWSY